VIEIVRAMLVLVFLVLFCFCIGALGIILHLKYWVQTCTHISLDYLWIKQSLELWGAYAGSATQTFKDITSMQAQESVESLANDTFSFSCYWKQGG
jgi:hypothetical protein